MELKDIQELIRMVSKLDVSEVELEQEGVKLTIKTSKQQKGEPATQIVHVAAPQAQAPVAAPVHVPATVVNEAAAPATPAPAANEEANLVAIKSPMIGTFYRSSGPDKDVFVKVGDKIGAGDVVCIIEAMKLFNEIESEISGEIVKVAIDNATPVEYDQVLFWVKP